MPTNTIKGDLLTARGVIVHGCNAQGVMGAGVAKAIKEKWPSAFQAYRDDYLEFGLKLGTVIYAVVEDGPDDRVIVANAITQETYGSGLQVDYQALRNCFRDVAGFARSYDLSVHYPKIGAGLGGGDWEQIAKIIDEELTGIEHTLWVL